MRMRTNKTSWAMRGIPCAPWSPSYPWTILGPGKENMKKIPTIFVRDLSQQPALAVNEWTPGCEWVRDGEGSARRKYDGTCCLVRDGKLYKRRELRQGERAPAGFESTGTDEVTGKTVGWVLVGEGPEDRWHREALAEGWNPDGTYELLG